MLKAPKFIIEVLHENIYSFLREQHPEMRFALRSTNNNSRLSKGYWLLGNDQNVMLSLWNATDSINKTPNIYFVIEVTGRCYIHLCALDSEEKAQILSDLAIILDAKLIKRGDKGYFWRKYYDGISSYVDALNVFFTDKQKIDISLKPHQSLFPSYSPATFHKNVERIEQYRKEKKSIPINEPISAPHWQLKAVQIASIGHFEDISIPLDKNIVCFIGENGTGKSTMLRAILLGMIGIDYVEVQHKNIQNLLTIQSSNKEGKKFADIGVIRIQNDCIDTALRKEVHKVGIVDKSQGLHELYNSEDDFTILGEKEGTFQQLIIGFGQQANPITAANEPFYEKQYPHFQDVAALIYNEPDTRFDKFVLWLRQSMDTQNPASERIEMEPVVKQIFEVISEITGNDLKLIHELDSQEVKIVSNEHLNGLPLHLISQGYNNVIGWVGFFMKRLWETTSSDKKQAFKESYATCFIDEIDTYLHPKWQRTILATLAKHFPNTQFIVSTHSPFVLTYLPNENDNVLIYKIMQNGATVSLTAAGRDIRSFLLEWFEIAERPDFAQKEIDALYQAFEAENPNFAQLRATLARLRQKYTDNDPDLLKAEHILNVLED